MDIFQTSQRRSEVALKQKVTLQRGFQAHQSESCVNVTAKTSERLSKLIGDKVLDDSANIGAAISPVALAALTIISKTLFPLYLDSSLTANLILPQVKAAHSWQSRRRRGCGPGAHPVIHWY